MAKEFAKPFYDSKQWKVTKKQRFLMDGGRCVICGSYGEEVHHKVWLTEENINDPNISLNLENLITLCHNCHTQIHLGRDSAGEGFVFDANGYIIASPHI